MQTFKVYRSWIADHRIYITASNKKEAVQIAKTLEGWKTSHVISCEPSMRGTSKGVLFTPRQTS